MLQTAPWQQSFSLHSNILTLGAPECYRLHHGNKALKSILTLGAPECYRLHHGKRALYSTLTFQNV